MQLNDALIESYCSSKGPLTTYLKVTDIAGDSANRGIMVSRDRLQRREQYTKIVMRAGTLVSSSVNWHRQPGWVKCFMLPQQGDSW